MPGPGGMKDWGMTADGYRVSIQGDVKVLELHNGNGYKT